MRTQSFITATFSTLNSMVENGHFPTHPLQNHPVHTLNQLIASFKIKFDLSNHTPGGQCRCYPSYGAPSSFGEHMFSSRSCDKILDESDIELITIRILLLKIDLIFKYTLQSRMVAVKRLKQHLKTWSRRAELDSIYYT